MLKGGAYCYKKIFMATFRILFLNVLMLFGLSTIANAQGPPNSSRPTNKRPVDTSDFSTSNATIRCEVSQNGKYCFSYLIDTRLSVSTNMVVEVIATHKKYNIIGINKRADVEFINDAKQIVFVQGKDSLCFLNLSDGSKSYINQASVYLNKGNSDDGYLAYIGGHPEKALHILNIHSRKEVVIADAISPELINCGNALWLTYKKISDAKQLCLLRLADGKRFDFADVSSNMRSPNNKAMMVTLGRQQLIWLNLVTGNKKLITYNAPIQNCTFNDNGDQLVYTTEADHSSAIWYVNENMAQAEQLISSIEESTGTPGKVGQIAFNKEGNLLIVSAVTRAPITKENSNILSNVRIWNYQDERMPFETSDQSRFWLSINLKTKTVFKLDPAGESIQLRKTYSRYLLASSSKTLSYYYNPTDAESISIVDVTSGVNNKLVNRHNFTAINISPREKYVTWFDMDSLNWFSYETLTGIKRNISKSIPFPMYDKYPLKLGRIKRSWPFGTAAWSKNDKRVYLYDQYDVWEVDPVGIMPPICITHGTGRKEKTTLKFPDPEERNQQFRIIKPGDELVFAALNIETKDSGFWTLKLGADKAPKKKAMLPFGFGICRSDRTSDDAPPPYGIIRGIGNTDLFLVNRQSAEDFPNYFLTSDFKNYYRLTDFQPQKNYNWLTAELVNWQLPDGTKSKGILYKPENFDPSKKYPLIFDFYQGRSNEFHLFREVNYSIDRINIPYYVSNGYLIFIPDIFNKKGANSQSVVEAVVSAAKYLSMRTYVDSTKMALAGHSLGGWETNVLVTHTKKTFAAACEASGMSDFISWYDEIPFPGLNQVSLEAEGQLSPYGVGVTPWNNLCVYAKDSPILLVDQVTTPLLMVHGDKDDATPYPQGLEMYLALRRAGKKVWLLEYPDGHHGFTGDDSKDYTIRMKQFFDYYLKGTPPPKWMTHAINAAGYKEQVGHELDQSGVQP